MKNFNHVIDLAYKDTNRSKLWLACALQVEASELAELIMKKSGYDKTYTSKDILSEAGDVLNLTAALLRAHGFTVEDAMRNNEQKLERRGRL